MDLIRYTVQSRNNARPPLVRYIVASRPHNLRSIAVSSIAGLAEHPTLREDPDLDRFYGDITQVSSKVLASFDFTEGDDLITLLADQFPELLI